MMPNNVRLSENGDAVVILDQTRLPRETRYLTLNTLDELYDAIYTLKVRGAPAIGIFAAYSMYVLSRQISADTFDRFYAAFCTYRDRLNASRPTAVNLSTMLFRMDGVACANRDKPIPVILDKLKQEAEAIQKEDIEMCLKISTYGLSLIRDGDGILTHCNAGPLATSLYGTGLGTLFLAKEKGYNCHAYVDETRPLLQGARLTAYELSCAGIDCTLICDNMASLVMRQGKINACFVGCDRVARNGDTANKIGTSGVAVLAKHYNIPFYVFCPSSTIDFSLENGDGIVIEERNPHEISTMFYSSPVAPENGPCYNPAFDVTPAELISAIITERGICRYPYTESFSKLFKEKLS